MGQSERGERLGGGEAEPAPSRTVIAIAFEPCRVESIRSVARRLDDPRAMTWDDRRDLANLLNLVIHDGYDIREGDL